MKILVCGSEGSLMQATIAYLLKDGHEVIGVDSFFRYGKEEKERQYQFIEGDLCDSRVVEKACRNVDAIIQAAARIFGVSGFHKYPADILSHDVVLHRNVLQKAVCLGIAKVVFISSSMVYERATRVPSSEDDVDNMLVPLTDYGLSKLTNERLSKAFYQQYGLKYTIWRPFNVITPYERGEKEPGISHVFADFIRKIVINKQNPMDIIGDGEQLRCFTWIEDVASGISRFSFDHRTDCETFNLGNPEPITMRELALEIHRIAKETGVLHNDNELTFQYVPGFDDDVRVRIPSIEKAERALGWHPKVKLKDALALCLETVSQVYCEELSEQCNLPAPGLVSPLAIPENN